MRVSFRNRELLNLVAVGVLTGLGFASVYIARQDVVSTGSLTYAAFFFALYLVAHVVTRYTVPDADPYLLPIAGLLSEAPLDAVVATSRGCIEAAAKLGCTLESPFQQLAFLALSVIPSLKITDAGLVDVDRFELVPLRA